MIGFLLFILTFSVLMYMLVGFATIAWWNVLFSEKANKMLNYKNGLEMFIATMLWPAILAWMIYQGIKNAVPVLPTIIPTAKEILNKLFGENK